MRRPRMPVATVNAHIGQVGDLDLGFLIYFHFFVVL
jgi:hypothetical protein